MRQVYLDSQAATPLLPEALEAMRPLFAEEFGSASSLHRRGLRAREALDLARQQIAAFIHAESPADIIFTSDGAESANLAIKGAAWANQRQGNHIVVSATEHPSILNSVQFLEAHGFRSTKVGTDREGIVDPHEFQAALTDQTILIAVHHVNHDIGSIQPIREIGEIAAARGIPFYVDAEASAGWLPVDVKELGASLLSFSPHRFYGPTGVGVLYRHRRARLTPLLHGGDQENGRRAGVENIPAIVGAGVAAQVAARELSSRSAHVFALQQALWQGLRSGVPRIHLNGPEPGRLRVPTNLNISFECIEGEGLALLCDMNGIAIGAGAACVSKSLGMAPALRAIGLEPSLAQGAVIFSLGKDNTPDEINYVVSIIPKLVLQLRNLSPTWS